MKELQPEQFAQTPNAEICYQCFGDASKPALLLVMGLATQMVHWDNNFCLQLAEKGYWVIRFDNRDIGLSTKFTGQKAPGMTALLANKWFNTQLRVPYDLNDMARDTLGLMDFLNIEKAHVVGASMGGMIAQCMAILAPDRLLSLTSIMSTTGNRQLPKPKSSVTLQLLKQAPSDQEAYLVHALKIWRLFHGDTYPFEEKRVAEALLKARNRSYYPAGMKRQLSAIIASPDRTRDLAKVNVPSLIVHGNDDPLVPVECGLATAQAIPNAKCKIFEGMGHTLPSQLWPEMIDEIDKIATA